MNSGSLKERQTGGMAFMINLIKFIIICAAFTFASYTDIRERKIRIWVFPLMSAFILPINIYQIAQGNNTAIDILDIVGGAVFGFCLFFIFALMKKGGGGDIIMHGCFGLSVGFVKLCEVLIIAQIIIVIQYLVTTVVNFFCKGKLKKMKKIPMAVYSYAGFLLDSLLYII